MDRYNNSSVSSYFERQALLEKGGELYYLAEVPIYKSVDKKDNRGFLYVSNYTEITTVFGKYDEKMTYLNRDERTEKVIKKAIEVFETYYRITLEKDRYNENNLMGYYTEETPVKVIAEKKADRDIYSKFKQDGILMILNLATTPYKGFRKNVTVEIYKENQVVINQNKKRVLVRKYRGGLSSYELKKA